MNKTKKYLSHLLKLYGNEFVIKLSSLYTINVYLKDLRYNVNYKDCIVYIFDINGRKIYDKYENIDKARSHFYHVLSYFKNHKSYVDDYPYSKDSTWHCVVFKLPKPVEDLFLKGKYSKIYNEKEIEMCFSKKSSIKDILLRDNSYKPKYLQLLNSTFNTTLSLEEIVHHEEFDIPPKLIEEVCQ